MNKRTRTSDNGKPNETEGDNDEVALAEDSDEVGFLKELPVSRNGNDRDGNFSPSEPFLLFAEKISASMSA